MGVFAWCTISLHQFTHTQTRTLIKDLVFYELEMFSAVQKKGKAFNSIESNAVKRRQLEPRNHSFTLTWLRKMYVDKPKNVLSCHCSNSPEQVHLVHAHTRVTRSWLRLAIGFLFDYTKSGWVVVEKLKFFIHFSQYQAIFHIRRSSVGRIEKYRFTTVDGC